MHEKYFHPLRHNISPTKNAAAKMLLFPVLLYGAEAWTIMETLMKKLEAFEMWVYPRILKISWATHTNVQVLRRMGKQKEISFTIKKRNLKYFGHIMRHDKYRILQLITQGKIESKRGPGRKDTHDLKTYANDLDKNRSSYSETPQMKLKLP